MKPKINYVVDVIMAVFFLITAVSGLVLFYYYKFDVSGPTILGVPRETWSFMHNWGGIILIALILLHFIFHWKWLSSMTGSMFGKKEEK